ncbi:ABC transporter ATP-binding protein [Cesiribacter andamanensis]|uniref:Putative multidrug export ATP-binding/permease protein n=1 Tax=Cesiribacter andamanensis AMV16 TaxID=1279009 RepID=M7N041_9BACT|nr:ABC transporter transmembrane domain-containing protein [Cesiribacter andamanensis]EMR02058.1 Putative multidrug export ATP-binding/permease protein [Cesiribacter andamanensis AMV16]
MAKRRDPLQPEEKRKLTRENLSKLAGIFRYILPYRWLFAAGMGCLLVSSLSLLSFPYVAARLVDAATGTGQWFISGLNNIALFLLGILFIQAVFSFLRVYLFAQVSERSMADLRRSLYGRYMSLPMSFYDNQRTGELLSRITSDVSQLQDTFTTTLAEFVRQILTLTVGTAIIFYLTPKLAGFMLATFPLIVVVGILFGNFIRRLSKQIQDQLAKANVVVEETLQSIPMVKAFTSERYETQRYGSALDLVVRTALKAAGYRGAFISFIIFILFGGIVAVIWYGALLVQAGDITIGALISFVLYTTFIGGSIAGLGDLYGQLQKAIGASERVLQIIAMPGELSLEHSPERLPLQGRITYQGIRFAYPTRPEVEVLQELSLQIAAGEKIALVGHSGAGKSTIVQLLLRFYEPLAGQLLVDGQDIRTFDLSAYRANLGIVPQEVILFGGSIRENIAYGRPGASDAQIREAARKANALDFIEHFPEGFATLVGERGVKLSGGQRQRIAIARAILKDPRILILDEATSSLDAESEHLVQTALDQLMLGRTTIIIAHRLATIRKADRIYVISGGQIAESGTHEELLQISGGTYANLVRLQLQEEA